MAGDDKSLNAFGTASCPHLSRFREFCGILSSLYGVGLDVPEFDGDGVGRLSSLKQFLSGLIEGRKHPWRVPLRRVGIRARMSIAHSLFLFRKTLPSPRPDLDKFMDQISSDQAIPDWSFLNFCRAEIKRIFPSGWDRSLYPNKCISTVVSTNSCAENGKSRGGCRSWVLDNRMPDISCRDDFVEAVLTKSNYQRPRPSRLVAVDTGGKWRKITVPSVDLSLLRPLHQSIYEQLSKQKWLLRGKESTRAFKDFSSCNGEVFVSGDYESATDNLNVFVSRFVLSRILDRSCSVPAGISRMAIDSLSLPVCLSNGDKCRTVNQTSGQMMGYLLSFPLLCLINYLTFRYAIRRDVPVKINGDDIVFRSTPEEKDKWFRLVGQSGLTLSVGKTMVNKRFFTLNSCLFEGRLDGPRTLPFVRSSALFPKSKDPEAVMGLKGRYQSFCPGFCGVKRSYLRTCWLRLNRGIIDVTRRSVSRGLGLCVTFPELVESGLWAREAWHLELAVEKPLPAPFSEWSCRPIGYKYLRVERITKELKAASEGVSAAWLESAWTRSAVCSRDDWFTEMKRDCYDWGHWASSRSSGALRRARLLKLSVRNANRYLRPRRCLFNSESFKQSKRSIWVREDFRQPLELRSAEGEFVSCRDLKRTGSELGSETIDYRDFLEAEVVAREVIIGNKGSFTGEGIILDRSRVHCGAGSGFVRLYPGRGVGIAPPSCLS